MSKHTPGPWKTEDDGDLAIVPAFETNAGFIVAKLFGPDAAANARLIAAASDLLAALKAIIKDQENTGVSLGSLSQAARAAIAKAEGTS